MPIIIALFQKCCLYPSVSGIPLHQSEALHEHKKCCNHAEISFNLDPAAECFDYQPIADIRDLIIVDDVMEDDELKFGSNGGLVFAMEFLLENMEWLEEALGEEEDDYILSWPD